MPERVKYQDTPRLRRITRAGCISKMVTPVFRLIGTGFSLAMREWS
jgi:hypothetical protein